jgi:L-ascorbate metabolism protein UlaG (beta-lactamase superfamily)
MAMTIRLPIALLCLSLAGASAQESLEATFIGNMAFAITDGTVTVMTDFPYESGYSGYMTYAPERIRSETAETLALITHGHRDHWDRALFEKTGWMLAGPPDVAAAVPERRVIGPSGGAAVFGPVRIEPLETAHANVDHYSYVLTWHGKRLYFSGDTESVDHLLALEDLDVAFVSPWLYRSALKRSGRIGAQRIVIYHHDATEAVSECRAGCIVPRQGERIRIQ